MRGVGGPAHPLLKLEVEPAAAATAVVLLVCVAAARGGGRLAGHELGLM